MVGGRGNGALTLPAPSPLQSPKLNDNPLLKADAVKFVTTFR